MNQNEFNEIKSLLNEIIGMTCTIGYDSGYPLVEEKARKTLKMIEDLWDRQQREGFLNDR